MKTLKDIAVAIAALPVTAFKGTYGSSSEINEALRQGFLRWTQSQEHAQHERLEEIAREERRKKDGQKLAERERNVRKWLKDGTLVKGTFIKVTGARDGKGIRELVEVKGDRLVCRQWTNVRIGKRDVVFPDRLRAQGCLKVDGMWIEPQEYMTTHDYCRVAKILS